MPYLDRIYEQLTALDTISPLAFALAALAGAILAASPTVLALAPALVGYVAREPEISRRKAGARSLAFVLGTATTFAAYGLVFGWAGAWLAPIFGRNGYLVSGLVLVTLGTGILRKVRFGIPTFTAPTTKTSSYCGAYLLGIPFGFVGSACPCSIPVVLAMLFYAGGLGNAWVGAALLFVFAFVRGIPLIIAGTLTGWFKEFKAAARWQPALEKGAGVLMLLLGAGFITYWSLN